MKFIDILKESFRTYKEKFADSALFGLISSAIGIISLVPIAGAFIYSYFYPRILRWFAKKIELLEEEVDLKPAFFALLIPKILIHIVYVFILVSLWNLIISKGLIGGIGSFISFMLGYLIPIKIVLIIALIAGMILIYTIYANVVGRLKEFKIFPLKSIKLFAVAFVVNLGLSIISVIFDIVPVIGSILRIIFSIVVMIPLPNIVALRYVKEL